MKTIQSILLISLFICAHINLIAQEKIKSQVLLDFTQKEAQQKVEIGNATKQIGKDGLNISIQPKQATTLTISGDWDFSSWIYLTIEIRNNGKEEFRFDPIISGELGPNRWPQPLKTIGWAEPGETRLYNCLLLPNYSTRRTNSVYREMTKDFPNTRGMPSAISFTNGFDLAMAKKIQIKFPKSDFERSFTLKSIQLRRAAVPELYQKDKAAFFPFIDEYGQYKHADWPGKIKSDKQLEKDIETEKKDLAKHTGSKEWSKFGGYKNGKKYKATGHFRTEKVNGRWWIIDPEGYVFWSMGINSACQLHVKTPYTGRENFFEKLPQKDDPVYGKFYKNKEYDFGQAALHKKYEEVDEKKYAELGFERMRSWGFNTLGGWSYEKVVEFPEKKRIPYTLTVWTQNLKLTDKFPDVFNPKWKKTIRNWIKAQADKVNDDPYFIGYFVDNEMHWFSPNGMAAYVLGNATYNAGKKYYIDQLKKQLKDIDTFNQKTGKSFASWDALQKNRKKFRRKDVAALKEINIEFYNETSERYFRSLKEIRDEVSPNKLLLGCRWHVDGQHRNHYNVRVSAKYLDIISFNEYANEITPKTFPEMDSIDKPYIVSEFNFGAIDRGKFYPGLNYGSDQRNRGEKFQNFVESAMRDPKCVGAHWFMWANSTTAGRSVVGENANCGILSEMDQPYYEMLKYMRETTYTLYKYRTGLK